MKNFRNFALCPAGLAGLSRLYDRPPEALRTDLASGRNRKSTRGRRIPAWTQNSPDADALNRERRALVKSGDPRQLWRQNVNEVAVHRQNELDPFDFFFRNRGNFVSAGRTLVQTRSLGVIVPNEGHIINTSPWGPDRGNQGRSD